MSGGALMLGIFGGTFDPIHLGHLRSAWELAELLNMPVHMIPAGDPPHRDPPHANAQQRWQMLELALAEQDRLIADDREIRRQGRSYMVDTLADLRQETGQPLTLILGRDAFAGLASWHQWRRLFELANIVVLARPGTGQRRFNNQIKEVLFQRVVGKPEQLLDVDAGKIAFAELTQLDISATKVRDLFGTGHVPRFLLPAAVLRYIEQHRLYS